MRLGTAIEHLVEAYIYASDKEWIQDKVAWALYQTWKEADRKDEQFDKDIYVRSKYESLPTAINGVQITSAVAWADKWLEDNPVSEMWDMIRTLRDATEWQTEPQTEREGE